MPTGPHTAAGFPMRSGWLDGLTVSEETSLSLLDRAQHGDGVALEALMGRYLARLQRWASGRLPARARSLLDTDDVVQDALLGTFRRLDHFKPKHDGALLAYLRQAVHNRIRKELRRHAFEIDEAAELEHLPIDAASPLERALSQESLARYEYALGALDETDRAAIIGRFEMGYSYDALARAMDRPSSEAARKLTERALRRLIVLIECHGS
jgi:RNA polymerase sigma factor (sigma-70 family)